MKNRMSRTVWVGALMFGLMTWMTAVTQPLLPKANELPSDLDIVPRDAAMFITVRVADMWENHVPEQVRQMLTDQPGSPTLQLAAMGLKIENIERATVVVPTFEPRGMTPIIIVATKVPYDKKKLLIGNKARVGGAADRGRGAPDQHAPLDDRKVPTFEKKSDDFPKKCVVADDEAEGEAPAMDAPYYLIEDHQALILIDEKTFAIIIGGDDGNGGLGLIAQLIKSRKSGALSDALSAASQKHLIVMGLNPTLLMSSLSEDLPPVLIPVRALLTAKGMTMIIDSGETGTLAINLIHADAAAAKKASATLGALRTLGVQMIPSLRKELARQPEMKAFLPILGQFEKGLDEATIIAKDDRVEIRAAMSFDGALTTSLTPVIASVRAAAGRAQASNNFKQIALGFHNYESAFDFVPPASDPDMQSKFPVSWRVRILPFIEQENLYRMYKFDEPWDSENNKKLIPLMPKIYELPGFETKEKGQTFIQVFTGRDAMFAPKQRVSLAAISDGTSNTIMLAEAANPVVWTRPDDLVYDEKKPVPKLGGHYPGGFLVGLGDGSVRFVKSTIKEANLRALITRSGGEVLGFDD